MLRHKKPQPINLNVDRSQITCQPLRIEHEPASTQCACGCQLRRIGEDVSEKLNFRLAQFYKEQHVRGKWVCDQCDTLTQQAMPAYVIDKGIASPELLSHVLVSKYADHLPLYRQRLLGAVLS